MHEESRWRRRARRGVALAFLIAGALHFVATESETKLVPAFFPWRRGLVLLSGAAEIVGALGLLHPRTRRPATYGLAALLVAVFPANINHAVNNIQVGATPAPALYHWLRLPAQPLLIGLVLWCGGIRRAPRHDHTRTP
jgi:uncharacterized membrane protein